ncbi:glycoside hydrolase family 36 N-terminal domain-containing protein [Paenibacillus maysiensis]|uniref:glycoside hydrolase family 36 N-terminal domain-containing protein n=1 Tax=Paenibacillus maysiensis TaxID=1155954 RepID=UPI0024761BD1|nr:glycoside hydrolase family 36 N-terminal domain-containing protein [Paenibacillus maysiensis]
MTQGKPKSTGLSAVLQYKVINELDAITRSVRSENIGSSNVTLRRALSCNVDFVTVIMICAIVWFMR